MDSVRQEILQNLEMPEWECFER